MDDRAGIRGDDDRSEVKNLAGDGQLVFLPAKDFSLFVYDDACILPISFTSHASMQRNSGCEISVGYALPSMSFKGPNHTGRTDDDRSWKSRDRSEAYMSIVEVERCGPRNLCHSSEIRETAYSKPDQSHDMEAMEKGPEERIQGNNERKAQEQRIVNSELRQYQLDDVDVTDQGYRSSTPIKIGVSKPASITCRHSTMSCKDCLRCN